MNVTAQEGLYSSCDTNVGQRKGRPAHPSQTHHTSTCLASPKAFKQPEQQEQGLVRLKAAKGWLTIPTAQGHKLELPSPLKQTRVVVFSSLPLRIALNTKTAAEALFF